MKKILLFIFIAIAAVSCNTHYKSIPDGFNGTWEAKLPVDSDSVWEIMAGTLPVSMFEDRYEVLTFDLSSMTYKRHQFYFKERKSKYRLEEEGTISISEQKYKGKQLLEMYPKYAHPKLYVSQNIMYGEFIESIDNKITYVLLDAYNPDTDKIEGLNATYKRLDNYNRASYVPAALRPTYDLR